MKEIHLVLVTGILRGVHCLLSFFMLLQVKSIPVWKSLSVSGSRLAPSMLSLDTRAHYCCSSAALVKTWNDWLRSLTFLHDSPETELNTCYFDVTMLNFQKFEGILGPSFSSFLWGLSGTRHLVLMAFKIIEVIGLVLLASSSNQAQNTISSLRLTWHWQLKSFCYSPYKI